MTEKIIFPFFDGVIGVFKSLWTNKFDLIAMIVFPLIFSVVANFIISTGSVHLAIVANIFYALTIASIAIHFPWIAMGITAPNTFGSFINNHWEEAFKRMRGEAKIDPQFLVVWITYLILVAVTGAICTVAFIGIPALQGV